MHAHLSVDKVMVHNKGIFSVGFVHFAQGSVSDNYLTLSWMRVNLFRDHNVVKHNKGIFSV